MNARRRAAHALAAALCLVFAGCGGPSATGSWTGALRGSDDGGALGKLGEVLTGSAGGGRCRLQLNRGGHGYLKLGPVPEAPIEWRQDGLKVVISASPTPARGSQGGSRAATTDASFPSPLVGTLSQGGHKLTLDLGVMRAEFEKAP